MSTDFAPTSTSLDLLATNFKAHMNTAIVDENSRGILMATQTVVVSLLLMTVVLILI